MSRMDEISARLTVLEIVVSQMITHMAVRADDPPGWVQTRKALATYALDHDQPPVLAKLLAATEALFEQAELVAADYRLPGTNRATMR